jgi:hypothetical protein
MVADRPAIVLQKCRESTVTEAGTISARHKKVSSSRVNCLERGRQSTAPLDVLVIDVSVAPMRPWRAGHAVSAPSVRGKKRRPFARYNESPDGRLTCRRPGACALQGDTVGSSSRHTNGSPPSLPSSECEYRSAVPVGRSYSRDSRPWDRKPYSTHLQRWHDR